MYNFHLSLSISNILSSQSKVHWLGGIEVLDYILRHRYGITMNGFGQWAAILAKKSKLVLCVCVKLRPLYCPSVSVISPELKTVGLNLSVDILSISL